MMYTLICVYEPKLVYYRIKCPDGRLIGFFHNTMQAQGVLAALNGLKNPN